jgi:hypothetical protein
MGTVVEHSALNPKSEGSNLATGTGRDKNGKIFYALSVGQNSSYQKSQRHHECPGICC